MTGPILASSVDTIKNTTSTTDNVTMPAGVVAGDLLLIVGTRGASPGTWVNGAWTTTVVHSNAGTVWGWKIASGSEGASQAFTSSNSRAACFTAMRITGANAVTPIDTTAANPATVGTSMNKFQGTASIAGTVMTVTAVTSGTLSVGDVLVSAGGGGTPPVTIISFGTGGGGTGTYNISSSITQASATEYSSLPTFIASTVTPAGGNTDGLLISSYHAQAKIGGLGGIVQDGSETLISNVNTTNLVMVSSAWQKLNSNAATGNKTASLLYAVAYMGALSILITK